MSCINRTKSDCFPVKGVGGLSLIFSEAIVVATVFSAIVSGVGFVYHGVKVSVSVSMYQVSLSQSLEVLVVRVSEFRGIKVSGCAVEIQAWSLVSLHFC
jgi:hypothetical protein